MEGSHRSRWFSGNMTEWESQDNVMNEEHTRTADEDIRIWHANILDTANFRLSIELVVNRRTEMRHAQDMTLVATPVFMTYNISLVNKVSILDFKGVTRSEDQQGLKDIMTYRLLNLLRDL